MIKKYEKPTVEISVFESDDVITTSGVGLTNGGENGKANKESLSSMFSK